MARKDMPTRKPETVTGAMEAAQLAEVVPTDDQNAHRPAGQCRARTRRQGGKAGHLGRFPEPLERP